MTKHLKTCSCGRRVHRFAVTSPKEMCHACYAAANKERFRQLAALRAPCAVDGCDGPSVAKGYCDKHYRMFVQYGTPTPAHAEHWGAAKHHPLYGAWQHLRKSGYASKRLDASWKDFWQFVKDMGDKPSPRHTLQRRDTRKGYSAGNCYWREPATDMVGVSRDREASAAYQRLYRIRAKKNVVNTELKKLYGIGIKEYEEMHKRQSGLCAICGKPERRKSPTSDGTARRLCVDHCHDSKRVRELLCGDCNSMIGYAEDNPHILEAAIAYLKKHAGAS